MSEVIRELLEEYVKNRDIGSYIDDLWGRIGTQLTSRGVRPEGIQRFIRAVREKR